MQGHYRVCASKWVVIRILCRQRVGGRLGGSWIGEIHNTSAWRGAEIRATGKSVDC